MKAFGGVDVEIHVFFNSALAVGEWSASRPGRFNTRERTPGTNFIGGWVDPRADLDDVEKRNSLPYQDSNFDLSVVLSVVNRYTDCAIPAPKLTVTCMGCVTIKQCVPYQINRFIESLALVTTHSYHNYKIAEH
jgi:hypothetical protein